jgi:hypothetical protein
VLIPSKKYLSRDTVPLKKSRRIAHSSNIAEPETELLGMPELFVELASTINLTCSIRNTHRPPAKVVS